MSKIDSKLVKPVIAFGTAIAIDRFYFQERDLNSSMYFAGATAAGIYFGSIVGGMAPDMAYGILGNGKQVEERITEIALGSASAYALNKYVFKNDYSRDQMIYKLVAIAACDFVGELGSDLLAGRPLDFLIK